MEMDSELYPTAEECGEVRSIFTKSRRPLNLKFEEVVYRIRTHLGKTGGGSSKKAGGGERTILNGVSGAVLPGEMLAMMGPSGSGKTTLLTALGGRLCRTRHLTGTITYNGRPFSNRLKLDMGFVSQDDVLYPHLTVAETLLYTALLRLPGTLTRREKAAVAADVAAQLGLAACRDSIIGGGLVRGVSGGERKRVSIGQEMLINPSLLLLDEPTSGLDATTAQRIVSTLWDLSKGGRTVVMTIHQPSSRLFYMFHKVLLLADGSPLYFGKGSDALDYFSTVGYAMPVPMNPADFLLDLANGVPFNETESWAAVKEALVSAYNTRLRNPVTEELRELSKEPEGREPDRRTVERWSTTWCEQFMVLLERGLKERRHHSFSGLKIAQVLVMALLSGSLWWQSGGHIQDQVGLFFFEAGFWGFIPLFQAIFTFPQERMMLAKERSSGMYRLSSYFVARTAGDLPMELILPAISVTIVYWMGGLKPAAASFFANMSVMLLCVLVAQGLGLALGALVMDVRSATTLASVVMLTFMIAGGYYVQNVPAFVSWIKYISLLFYTFKLLIASQYSGNETYRCAPGLTCKITNLPPIKAVGFDHMAAAVAALVVMLFGFRLVAYLALTRVGVTG